MEVHRLGCDKTFILTFLLPSFTSRGTSDEISFKRNQSGKRKASSPEFGKNVLTLPSSGHQVSNSKSNNLLSPKNVFEKGCICELQRVELTKENSEEKF